MDLNILLKNSSLRFGMNLVRITGCYLDDQSHRLVLNNVQNDRLKSKKEVPQGTVLGPLLFNLYENDMQTQPNCKIVQYAYDTVLFSSNHNIDESGNVLENCLIKKIDCFNFRSLKMNPDEEEFMVFSNHCAQKQLIIRDQVIGEIKEVKYLGVILYNRFRYDSHVKQILSKMIQGIKPWENLLSLLLSHIKYSEILFSTIGNNLIITLEKQLSWWWRLAFIVLNINPHRN